MLGLFLRKRKILGDAFLAGGNKVVFRLAIPANLFVSLYVAEIADAFDPAFVAFAVAFTLISFGALWGYGILFIKQKHLISAFVQGAFRSNLAVLGFPLWIYVLGNQAAARGALILAFIIPIYNVMTILVCTAHSNNGSKMSIKSTLLDIAKNPPIIGITLGIIIGLSPITMPVLLMRTINYLASLAMPLALICLGVAMTYNGLDERFRVSMLSSIMKVLVLPIIATAGAFALGFRGEDLAILMIMAGTPSAVAGYTMVEQLGGDGPAASQIVVFTTLLSAFTLTVFIYAFRTMGIII